MAGTFQLPSLGSKKPAPLSTTRLSELTIDAPQVPYKVVLRPELLNLSTSPDNNYFRVTDWIYTQEKDGLTQEELAKNIEEPVEKPTKRRKEEIQKGRLVKQGYLVDKEETDPEHRERLVEAMCHDLNSFYYYKKRHLFKPREVQIHGRMKFPQIKKTVTKVQSPSVSPELRKSPIPRHSPSPHSHTFLSNSPRPALIDVPKNQFLRTLVEKCDHVRPSGEVLLQTEKEREKERMLHKRLEWTRETLDQVGDCEVDILIPYYRHQKDALEDFQRDAHKMTEEYRRASIDPTRRGLKFERTLRKNKNMIL